MECILYAGKQERAPLCDRSQFLLISSEHDLTYDVTTWWPDMTSTWNLNSMCQIKQREGTASFAATRLVLRELLAKNPGGAVRSPPASASASTSLHIIIFAFVCAVMNTKWPWHGFILSLIYLSSIHSVIQYHIISISIIFFADCMRLCTLGTQHCVLNRAQNNLCSYQGWMTDGKLTSKPN